MTTSKDVFAKRKEGKPDEAYQMALQRMVAPDRTEWDDKALGWCLIDLIKRDVNAGMHINIANYRLQLETIKVPISDEVLTKQRLLAISLCAPNGQLANKAKQLSKSGQHDEAADIYRQLCGKTPDDESSRKSLGWELYRICKVLLDREPINIWEIKKNLYEYLKLNAEKPSVLHSRILLIATRLAGAEHFNIAAFSHFWGLEHLQPEDWKRFVTEDGKELSSLAEKVIKQVSKEATKGDDHEALGYILPYLDAAITEYPDNIWLSLNKAKILLRLGRNDEALKFAIDVTRTKNDEYWVWELLGDICAVSRSELSLSCYCKALLCSKDDQFSWKVRLKMATLLMERGQLPEAKYEINRIRITKEKEGNNIPAEVKIHASQAWYAEASLPLSNDGFYKMHITAAENLILSQLPWISGNVGDIFTIPGKENKPKRKLFIKTSSDPIEAVIPEGKFDLSHSVPGDAICLKGEFDSKQRFQIYAVSERNTVERWDLFTERVGVVDHVNHQKKLLHFLIDKTIDGIIPLSELDSDLKEGDVIAVRLSCSQTKQGPRYRALTAIKTDKQPSFPLKKTFNEEVNISDQFGFTTSDIFIPPPLVKAAGIQDLDILSGVALLSYNKKCGKWGWRAISAAVSSTS